MTGIHQTSSRSQAVHYDGPLFPSVHRLLLEYASSIKNPSEIKGTGIRGMITKGDVLAYLGKASGPLGTYAGKEPKPETATASKGTSAAKSEVVNVSSQFDFIAIGFWLSWNCQPMDGPALRQLIVTNLLQASLKTRNAPGMLHLALLETHRTNWERIIQVSRHHQLSTLSSKTTMFILQNQPLPL